MDSSTAQSIKSGHSVKESQKSLTGRQRLLNALRNAPNDRPPFWLMRQAGRCLPEYRRIKEKHTFHQLIANPELATEITLQPIERFGFDAAILFSDILVVAEAMGVCFHFRDEGGLEMETVKNTDQIACLKSEGIAEHLHYVGDALVLIKKALNDRAGLLGFAGAPWTMANFMLDGGGQKPHTRAHHLFKNERPVFDLLCEKITSATIDYLQMQANCGVDAVQIFDSLGGLLPGEDFEEASGRWIAEIVDSLRGEVPVILFSKGTRNWDAQIKTGVHVISIDHHIDIAEALRVLPPDIGIQGNLDPMLLLQAQPQDVEKAATDILNKTRGRNGYIFNLGHGVPPNARLENMETLAATVKNFL